MPDRERVVAKAPSFKGQRSGFPLESYGIESAELIQNFYLKNGQLKKINGNTSYATVLPSESGGVTSLHRFLNLTVAQRGNSLAMEAFAFPTVKPGVLVANKDFTQLIFHGFSVNKFYSAQWRNAIYLTNTRESVAIWFRQQGSSGSVSEGQIGLDPPDAPSQATFATWCTTESGNVENADHYYMISLYDSLTNTESPCWGALASADGICELSPNATIFGPQPRTLTAPGSAYKLTISGSLLYAFLQTQVTKYPRATHFIVYRAKAKVSGLFPAFFQVPQKDGGTYDGSTIIPINALNPHPLPPAMAMSFVDNTADANLPAVSPPTNNSPPPTPLRMYNALQSAIANGQTSTSLAITDYSGFRHFRFFRDQLFGIGAFSYGLNVSLTIAFGADLSQQVTGVVNQVSDLLHGSEVFQPDYWPYRWEVGRGDGQQAIGLGVLGDTALLCFKEKSAYYLSGSSPDNYVVRIMDTQKGCVDQSTIQETPSGVITLDRVGFVLWDKIGQGTPISESIRDVIDSILWQYAGSFWSCYDQRNNLYRCGVVLPGATTPNVVCTLNLLTMDWSLEQNGQQGLCRVIDTDSSFNSVDLLGSRYTGAILDLSQQTNVLNQGAPIEGIWQSGTINFGDDQHKKKMNWIYLRAKSNESWTIDIYVIPDYDLSRAYVIQGWNSVGSFSTWYSSDIATDGSLLWDDGSGNVGGAWSSDGLVRQVSKIPVKCIGRTFQIRIVHKDAVALNYGFTIESISAEATMLGR